MDYLDYEYKEIKDTVIGIINPDIFSVQKNNVKPNFLDQCKKYLSRLITKSEGWLMSALEENELGPK